MKHILFGLNQNSDKKIENQILHKYKKITEEEFTYDSEYYLSGIEKALSEKKYDVLILREDLENNNQLPVKFLDSISDKYPQLNVILVVNNEHQADKYVIDIFSLGIYNVLYKEDLTLGNVVSMIETSRSKLDTKIYLELDDVSESQEDTVTVEDMLEIPENELINIINSLRGATIDNISEMFDDINKQYERRQMLFLVTLLPEEIKASIKESKNENYIKYEINPKEEKQPIKIAKPILKKIEKEVVQRTVTITKEKIIGTVVIAVAGTISRMGTTHATISIAKFLRDNNFKVATLEYHKVDHFNFIKNNYENIQEGNNLFIFNDIYFYPYNEKLNILDVIQEDYNYVILDMGILHECDMAEFKRANSRIVVSGAKDWELNELEIILRANDNLTNSRNNYYFNFIDKDGFEEIKANMRNEEIGQLKCYQAPYNPNPYVIDKDCISLFQELLKDVLPLVKQDTDSKSKNILDLFKKLSKKR